VDLIELAERRYREIVADDMIRMVGAERKLQMPVNRILAWLTDYVVPAVEEVYQRPLFRDHATWPQRVLASGSGTAERTAVERVDRALIEEAKALRKLTRNALVARKLEEMAPPTEDPDVAETVTTSGNGVAEARSEESGRIVIPFCLARLEQMADRPWTDLVCTDDYFGPFGGMMRKSPLPEGATEGAFVRSLTPHLFYVGDSITRCLTQRIRCWIEFLRESRSAVYAAVDATGRPYEKQTAAEGGAWEEARQGWAELQRICLSGPGAQMREACIALVQVYAEFHLAPELEWLGVSAVAARRFKGHLRHNIESTRDLETLDRIAGALGELKYLYRDLAPEDSAIDAAIATGGLVLIEKTREAYWEGEKIDQEWRTFRKPWEFLWQLASNAKSVSPVNDMDLYGRPKPYSTVVNRWSRLKKLLPASLSRHVIPMGEEERAMYRLKYPSNRIHLFGS
jgi:hypothetical protein